MKFLLELEHKDLNRVRFISNGVEVSNQSVDNLWNTSFELIGNPTVEIWFWPWKIKPILRIDNHFVDYSLANVQQFDHMLTFEIHKDFFESYHKRLIESKIKSQFKDNDFNQEIYDAVIGYNQDQTHIIYNIKNRLNYD